MWSTTIVPVLILALVVCCMGQTFQYSRGWTNGKRSDSHIPEDTEVATDMDLEKKLERCIISLQRITRNPYIVRMPTSYMTNAKFPIVHRSFEGFDELGADLVESRIKRQINAD